MKFIRIALLCFAMGVAVTTSAYHRDTLHVAIYDQAPFAFYDASGEPDGLMVRLWEQVALRSGLTYRFQKASMSELLSGMEDGTFDVGIGAITVTPDREARVDFTHAIFPSAIGIATRKPSAWIAYQNRWKPVIGDIFGIILILILLLVISASAVLIVERKHARLYESDRSIKSLADGIWWSAVTMTTVGYGDKVPHSRFGKLVGVFWIFISVLLFTLFTANTSAKLASQPEPGLVKNAHDLAEARVGVVRESSSTYFVDDLRMDRRSFDHLEAALEALEAKELDAVIHNIHLMQYACDKNGYDDVIFIEQPLKSNYMGMTIASDCVWREEINYVLLDILYSARWQQLVQMYIGRD